MTVVRDAGFREGAVEGGVVRSGDVGVGARLQREHGRCHLLRQLHRPGLAVALAGRAVEAHGAREAVTACRGEPRVAPAEAEADGEDVLARAALGRAQPRDRGADVRLHARPGPSGRRAPGSRSRRRAWRRRRCGRSSRSRRRRSRARRSAGRAPRRSGRARGRRAGRRCRRPRGRPAPRRRPRAACRRPSAGRDPDARPRRPRSRERAAASPVRSTRAESTLQV